MVKFRVHPKNLEISFYFIVLFVSLPKSDTVGLIQSHPAV